VQRGEGHGHLQSVVAVSAADYSRHGTATLFAALKVLDG
jgi:hypothetical protein